ncbi:MAG: glycyl-radical enzyme activating protein [Dehalococcoidales bacterium]|nr:glycyl-radical enzyme activating protein [Dehalococcoidales bacterium]
MPERNKLLINEESKIIESVDGETEPEDVTGLIFAIQRFSIQDGPGIRTTVFLKGCPLRCKWCSNPESQEAGIELMVDAGKCTKCGRCLEVCPAGAIVLEPQLAVDSPRCHLALKCTEACLYGALEPAGKNVTVREVMKEVMRDTAYYRNSGGGITLSGGEPLYQPRFTHALLMAARKAGLHTAIDTSGFAPWHVFKQVLPYTDLLLYDVKHMDSQIHKEATGVDNLLILENLRKLSKKKVKIWLRIPLIPGFNDSEDNLRKTGDLAKEIVAEKVTILPYHEWGRTKYEKLGRSYKWVQAVRPDRQYVQEVKELLQGLNLHVTVGS